MAIGALFPNAGLGAQMRDASMLPVSGHIDARVLAATTAERHAAPAGARFVRVTCTTLCYAKAGDVTVDAAIPAADVTDGSGSAIVPPLVQATFALNGATHISLIAPAISIVALEFWS